MKRLLAVFLSMLLVLMFLPTMAFAQPQGDFMVASDGTGATYSYQDNTLVIYDHSGVVISGNTTVDKIVVDAGANVTITLAGVDINLSDGCPFTIGNGATVTLILKDGTTNTLTAGGDNPGLHTGTGALTIQGTGMLTAWAGTPQNAYNTSAGIGGRNQESYGTITIDSGIVTATGSVNGAGIGGGYQSASGTIVINGGTVTGNGSGQSSNGGAGIGGGFGSAGPDLVEITGGTVVATGGCSGAGIGSGGSGADFTVVIHGGTVTANSRFGAAIGSGGCGAEGPHQGGTVTIQGGTVNATASGDYGGAGVGGSKNCLVNISGGNITATGTNQAAGIGSSYNYPSGSDDHDDGCEVNISGGTVTATGNGGGAGIGGGLFGKGGTVSISNGMVTAAGNAGGAGIGGGSGGSGGNVTITGGSVHAAGSGHAEAIGEGQWGASSGTLKNGNGDVVYLTEVTLGDPRGNAINAVTGISSIAVKVNSSAYAYGIAGVSTDSSGKLYLYLPEGAGTTAVETTEPANYYGTVQTAAGGSSGMLRLESKPEIDTTTLPNATMGAAYSQAIGHIGTDPIAWSILDGSLPTGLTLGAQTGVISGTPTAVGTFTFTVKAENTQGAAEKQLSITVARPPIVITSSTFQAFANNGFSTKLSATGLPTIRWSRTGGSLPAGITLSSDGSLSGTPTTAGAYTFTVQATNGSETTTKAIMIDVYPVITTQSLPSGKVGTAYSQALAATGNIKNPVWGVDGPTPLPAGLTLNAQTGVISGTPTQFGVFDLWICVTNSELAGDYIYGYTELELQIAPQEKFAITATPNNTAYGTVTGSGSYVGGASVTLQAIPKSGYHFIRWLQGSTAVSTSASYTFTASAKRTLTAEFAQNVAPSVTAALYGTNGAKLTWPAVSGAAKYEVYRATTLTGSYTKIATPTSAGYTDSGLAASAVYYYKVRSVYQSGGATTYSGYSAVVSVQTAPGVPASIAAASAGYDSVKLTWGAVAGATKYVVYRATSSTGTYAKVVELTSATYTNTGLIAGTSYYYKVRAYRVVGSMTIYGNYSAIVSAKPIPTAPTSVAAASAGYVSVKLTWGAVAGATKYEVYRAASTAGTYAKVAETTSASYTNTGLTTGTTYYFKVRAYRIVGSVKVYGNYSAVVSAKPVPATPTVKAAAVSSSSVKLSWVAVSGATKYEVYRATTSAGTYVKIAETASLSYTNSGLTHNKTYFYKVRAYRLVGSVKVFGLYSSIVSAQP